MNSLQLIEAFVNTAELEEGTDDLREPAGLVRWLSEHGLSGTSSASEREAADARAVREALRELLRANNGIDVDRDGPAAVLEAAARRSGLAVTFDVNGIRLTPRQDGGLGQVLAAVAETMADGSWQKLKACRSDTCRWAFVDHARNRSRHWCDMSTCGNRAKARTFRERHA